MQRRQRRASVLPPPRRRLRQPSSARSSWTPSLLPLSTVSGRSLATLVTETVKPFLFCASACVQ